VTRNHLVLIATAGSLALLLGAFGFQLAGYAPCHLCWLQRYPHMAAVALGLAALALPGRLWPALGGLAALTTAGLGAYHTGVERGWWEGPQTCTSGGVGGLSAEELLAQINAAPLIRCDEVAWALAGVSMASWNMIFSVAQEQVWIAAARTA
jgi:disulfide bond formation protein DsbB